jgi:hypothetical protein
MWIIVERLYYWNAKYLEQLFDYYPLLFVIRFDCLIVVWVVAL